ncbi:hypothetical protein VKT23_008894 [Stygiomarasmius scandens]|uniref:Tse2 ADP-ribosyltransferase toxin domain-containing protein n=1 Tax=Marasmiellus scandens TaxID=2682957 RepID=A0ABR1JGS0_9AGAR
MNVFLSTSACLRQSLRLCSPSPWARLYSTKPNPPLLGRYTTIPYELFRINASEKVILRDYEDQMKKGRASYDLVTQPDGLVHPKPGDTFEGPNGASVRPNGATMQEVVRNFRGRNTTIYRILPGRKLPDDLILLHEHSDHHSIQCRVPMKLSQLNKKITEFCQQNSEKMTKQEFIERYPFTV